MTNLKLFLGLIMKKFFCRTFSVDTLNYSAVFLSTLRETLCMPSKAVFFILFLSPHIFILVYSRGLGICSVHLFVYLLIKATILSRLVWFLLVLVLISMTQSLSVGGKCLLNECLQ